MSDDDRPEFDPARMLERWSDYWRRFPQFRRAPKLSFAQRCGAYAMMYSEKDIPQAVVCQIFGLSRATVSAIAGCRDDDRRAAIIEFEDEASNKTRTETVGVDGHLTKRRYIQRKQRYQAIADEFDRLGPGLFVKTYFTPELHNRMRNLRRIMADKLHQPR